MVVEHAGLRHCEFRFRPLEELELNGDEPGLPLGCNRNDAPVILGTLLPGMLALIGGLFTTEVVLIARWNNPPADDFVEHTDCDADAVPPSGVSLINTKLMGGL